MMTRELLEQLDQYLKGTLPEAERKQLEERMRADAGFKNLVDEHFTFVSLLKEAGERERLKGVLEDTHETLSERNPRRKLQTPLWQWIAVAASVSLISVVATSFFTKSQGSEFIALRRDLNQIQQSQKKMQRDILETKKKITPSPGNYAGSGFLISSKGYIATSYHVVRDADSVLVENEKFGLRKATPIFSDPVHDISILQIDGDDIPVLPYTLSATEAGLAESVYTLGYPREEVVFGEGSISALTGYRQDEKAYQISVPVNPGNSGGPLMNSKGDLVGMISGIQTQTLGASFAVKSNVLLEMIQTVQLDSLQAPILLSTKNTLPSNDKVKQVKRWREFVFMVRVYKN